MLRRIIYALLIVVILIIAYFLFWPVPIDPVAWNAPPYQGYNGVHAENDRLNVMELLDIGKNTGPEAIALDAAGRIYAGTNEGYIVRLQADGTNPENWVDTKGRPLGMDFDSKGDLIVADAYRGLLSISPAGKITELATEADGIPISFADDLDIATDGKIYFSDASTKFSAEKYGSIKASMLDLMEHGCYGRLLVYDPISGTTKTLIDGLDFANGVAVGFNQNFVLVNETGSARIIRYWIAGPKIGQSEPFIEALPGYPDNISRGRDGRFWVAFAFPRMADMEELSAKPFFRKVILRIPEFLQPKMPNYGHIIALDENGNVIIDLQDPTNKCMMNTSVTESSDYLYVGSAIALKIGRVPKSKVGL